MKFIKNKMAGLLLTTAATLFITGCDSDAVTKNDAQISYINALDEQATFYAKKSSASKNVYNNKHKVETVMHGDATDEIRHKWFGLEQSIFAVEDTNTRDEKDDIRKTLKDDRDYWVVAWLNGRDYDLSLIEKSSSDRDGLYRVRVFANDKLDVYLDGSNSKFLTTKIGKVSAYFSVEDCKGLVIEGNEIDLCTTGDFNRSYLAVVNDKGLIKLVEERR